MQKNEKPIIVDDLKKEIKSHSVVGILNMHKLPGRQLQAIKLSLQGKAKIKMTRKSLLKKALAESGLNSLENKIVDEPALILSDDNPFRLFKIIKESRSAATAKKGDVVNKDILISAGPTSLPPGPAISALGKVGLKASVQGGKIAVMSDKVILKAGETVTDDLANVFGMLKLEPMEIGLDLVAVWENGTVFGKDVLDISAEDYIRDLEDCVRKAVNLSVNTGYPTKQTIDLMITKAFSEARSLCMEADVLDKDFVDDVLAKAVRIAKALETKTGVIE